MAQSEPASPPGVLSSGEPDVMAQAAKARRFLELHKPGQPLLLANAWDLGSARILESLGFSALATTSSGFAATLGRVDYSVSLSEAIAHAAAIVSAVDLPVSADLENAYADEPKGVAACFELALGAGLAGASVEDYSGEESDPIYDIGLARERVVAAVDAAHSGPVHLVVTARAENYLHGRPDFADTIARLRAFAEVGADAVYAPGMMDLSEIRRTVEEAGAPVNVLVRPGGPTVAELAEAGVARISVGGAFAFAAYGGLVAAARELKDSGTLGWFEQMTVGSKAARAAFATRPAAASSVVQAAADAATGDTLVDEQGMESFPASDPPSNWAGPGR